MERAPADLTPRWLRRFAAAGIALVLLALLGWAYTSGFLSITPY